MGIDPVLNEGVVRGGAEGIGDLRPADRLGGDLGAVLAQVGFGQSVHVDHGEDILAGELLDALVEPADGVGHALSPGHVGRKRPYQRGHAIVDHVGDHQLDAGRHERVHGRLDVCQDALVVSVDLGLGPSPCVDPLIRGTERRVVVLTDGQHRVGHQSIVDLLGQPGVLPVVQKRPAGGAGLGPVELVALLAHVAPGVRIDAIRSHVDAAFGQTLDPGLRIGEPLVDVFVGEAVAGRGEPAHGQ